MDTHARVRNPGPTSPVAVNEFPTMKRILLATILFLPLAAFLQSASVQAQSVPTASSLAAIRKAAEQGDAASQHKLGVAYVNGQGVPEDPAQGMNWLRKALAQGHAETQLWFGLLLYQSGQDYSQAAELFRKAADQGEPDAQVMLGDSYHRGRGMPQDYTQSAYWYRKAAEQGNVSGQLFLGSAYASGQGVAQDYAQATNWYRKAAEQGDASAQAKVGRAYFGGHGVPQDYTKAVYWLRKSAEQGIAEAQLLLGVIYAAGLGVPKDTVLGYAWFNLAAAQGYEGAQKARDEQAEALPRAQLAEAQRLSSGWKSGQSIKRETKR